MLKSFSLWTLAVKNSKRHRLRTAVLIIAIAVFSSVFVTGLSLNIDTNAGLKKSAARLGADVPSAFSGARDYEKGALFKSYTEENLPESLNRLNKIFMFMVITCFVFSAFVSWTFFSAAIDERKGETGVMRVMGAKTRHIVELFMVEVVLLGVTGSAAGSVAGLYFILSRDTASGLVIHKRLYIALAGLVAGLFACALGALAPAIKLSKTRPSDGYGGYV